jgi:hypothetical protein
MFIFEYCIKVETKGISWKRTLKTERMKSNEKGVIILLSKDMINSIISKLNSLLFKDSEMSLTRLLCGA